jgi:hypothetical protein
MPRPPGVTAIASLFFLAAAYLFVLGILMLLAPGAVSMSLGAPLLSGLELAGPYMFLLMAALGATIGLGLLRLNRWARRAALIIAMIGVVLLVPTVSSAVIEFRVGLVWGWLGVIVRVVMIWYLYQVQIKEAFEKPGNTVVR